jgi:hypothetical protein
VKRRRTSKEPEAAVGDEPDDDDDDDDLDEPHDDQRDEVDHFVRKARFWGGFLWLPMDSPWIPMDSLGVLGRPMDSYGF